MSSVSDEVQCPQCRHPEAQEEVWYKSNHTITSCPVCGYSREMWGSEAQVWRGYGAYSVLYRNGYGVSGAFHRYLAWPLRLKRFRRIARKPRVRGFTVTRKMNGKWVQVCIKKTKFVFKPKHLARIIRNDGWIEF